VVNGLALTCKFPAWHSWEGPQTATGSYGVWCKPAHTVHVVNNFNFNFNFISGVAYNSYLQLILIRYYLQHTR
jgi:hypothetical protein